MPRARLPSRPLSDEQRRIAAENTALIAGAVDQFPGLWPSGGRDEALEIVTDAYVRAALSFDASRGRFSTLVYTCAKRALWDHHRTIARRERGREQYRRDVTRLRGYAMPELPREAPDTGWLDLLEERERRIVELRAQGLTLREVGAEVGLTTERVRQLLAALRPRVMAYLEAAGELGRS